MIDIRVAGLRIVHCGDIGERPEGATLAWLRESPIDLMIVPIGGFFTLGADGAAELVERCSPYRALACHSSNDGLSFPQLAPASNLEKRLGRSLPYLDSLSLDPRAVEADKERPVIVEHPWCRLRRMELRHDD